MVVHLRPTQSRGDRGDLVAFELPNDRQCKGCRWYRNGESVLVKVVRSDGEDVKNPGVGFPFLTFPLSVGKEWTYSNQLLNEKTNQSFPLLHTFKVLAYEDVKTKARMIKAFKISHSRERERVTEGSVQKDWGSAHYWYSPEAKVVIKREVRTLGALRTFGNDYELESFKLK